MFMGFITTSTGQKITMFVWSGETWGYHAEDPDREFANFDESNRPQIRSPETVEYHGGQSLCGETSDIHLNRRVSHF